MSGGSVWALGGRRGGSGASTYPLRISLLFIGMVIAGILVVVGLLRMRQCYSFVVIGATVIDILIIIAVIFISIITIIIISIITFTIISIIVINIIIEY